VVHRRQRPVVASEGFADRHHRRFVTVGGPARFDDHDVGIDDADLHAGPQRSADGVGRQAAMSEQHLDEGSGAGLVTEPATRRRPVVRSLSGES
jgi:hypothetical protein